MAIQSYNYFIDYINDNFASLHQQIKRFEEGFYDDFGVWCTDNTDWGMMYIVPQSVRHLKNSVSEYNLRVYFIDQLEKDDSNEREVISDQLSISRDFINWLHLNDENGYILTNTPNVVPFKSIVMDYTAGWYMDISVEVETEGSDCSIPFSGASTGYTICPISYVVNSDNSYSVTLDSGDTLILPNIIISSTGTGFTETIPSVQNYTIQDNVWVNSNGVTGSSEYGETIICTPVSPVNLLINSVQSEVLNSGTNFNLNATLDGLTGGTYNAATDTLSFTSNPSNLLINGIPSEVLSGGTTFNLNATLDGVTGGTYNPATDTLSFTSTQFLVGGNPLKTGVGVSYRTGDDYSINLGANTSWFVLDFTNPFGNTNRFTDTAGGQTYADNIVIDWSTYRQGKVLGYRRTHPTAGNWASQIDACLAVSIGIWTTGWHMTNRKEMERLMNDGIANPFNYAPFAGFVDPSAGIFTSTRYPSAPSAFAIACLSIGYVLAKDITEAGRSIPCRYFTVTGTVLT